MTEDSKRYSGNYVRLEDITEAIGKATEDLEKALTAVEKERDELAKILRDICDAVFGDQPDADTLALMEMVRDALELEEVEEIE